MRGAVVLVAVLAGFAGGLAVWLTPLDGLERAVWNLGLRNLLPQLNPPLGDTARLGLALLAALLAALAGWLLASLLGLGGRRGAQGAGDPASAPAWRLPAGELSPGPAITPRDAPMADVALAAPSAPAALAQPAIEPMAMPAIASQPGVAPAGGERVALDPPGPPTTDAPLVRATAPSIGQGSVAAPMAVDAPPPAPSPVALDASPAPPAAPTVATSAAPVPVAMDDAARAAMLASLARIESQLAEARQGPVVGPNAQLIARFEELDARVSAQVAQIAQQIVEVAQLARAATRSPGAAAAPVAPAAMLDAPRPLPTRPPRRPANRAELAAAIRGLRASLDAGPGLGGAA